MNSQKEALENIYKNNSIAFRFGEEAFKTDISETLIQNLEQVEFSKEQVMEAKNIFLELLNELPPEYGSEKDPEDQYYHRTERENIKLGILTMYDEYFSKNKPVPGIPSQYEKNIEKYYMMLGKGFRLIADILKKEKENNSDFDLYLSLLEIGKGGSACATRWKNVIETYLYQHKEEMLKEVAENPKYKKFVYIKTDELKEILKTLFMDATKSCARALANEFVEKYYYEASEGNKIHYYSYFLLYFGRQKNLKLGIIMKEDNFLTRDIIEGCLDINVEEFLEEKFIDNGDIDNKNLANMIIKRLYENVLNFENKLFGEIEKFAGSYFRDNNLSLIFNNEFEFKEKYLIDESGKLKIYFIIEALKDKNFIIKIDEKPALVLSATDEKSLEEAHLSYRKGYTTKALEIYTSLNERKEFENHNGLKVLILKRMGLCYLQMRKYDEAISMYNLAYSFGANVFFYAGYTYYKKFEGATDDTHKSEYLSEAIEYFSESLKLNSREFKTLYWRAMCFQIKSEFQSSIDDYSEVIRLEPNYYFAYDNIGVCYDNINYPFKAIANFEMSKKVFQNKPHIKLCQDKIDKIKEKLKKDSIFTNDVKELKDKASNLYKKNKIEETINAYSYIVNNYPGYADALVYIRRAICYQKLNQNERAIKDFKETALLEADYYNINTYLGKSYQDMKQYDIAIQKYSEHLEQIPSDIMALRNRGICNYRSKEYDNAIHDFSKAISVVIDKCNCVNLYSVAINKCNCVNLYIFMAICYADKGNFEDAIKSYNEAIKIDPNNRIALYNRGICYLNVINKTRNVNVLGLIDEEVLAQLINTKNIEPVNQGSIEEEFELESHLINILDNLDKPYKTIMKIFNKLTDIYFEKKMLLEIYKFKANFHIDMRKKSSDLKEVNKYLALEVLDCSKIIELDSKNSKVYRRRAKCYLELKQFDKAIDDLQNICKLNGSDKLDKEGLNLLGEAYLDLFMQIIDNKSPFEDEKKYSTGFFDHALERAIFYSNKVLEEDKDDITALVTIGTCYRYKQNIFEALKFLNRAYECINAPNNILIVEFLHKKDKAKCERQLNEIKKMQANLIIKPGQ